MKSPALIIVLLLIGYLLADPQLAAGQDTGGKRKTRTVEIVRADSGNGQVIDGETIRRLFGGVFIRQDSTELWADEAIQYVNREKIFFVGNVLIVDKTDSLTADTVWYDTRHKIGTATSQVRLFDGDVVVTAPAATYYVDDKYATFDSGVRLVDSATVLVSAKGKYWTEDKRAEFLVDVRLDEDRSHMEADSVTYFRETEISNANGNVFIQRFGGDEEDDEPVDSTRLTLLFGEQAYNDNKARFSRIEGDPLVVQLRRDSTEGTIDTTLVRASLIEVSRTDSLERVIARTNVRLWQPDMAAIADSVVFDRLSPPEDSTRTDDSTRFTEVRLFQGPVVWQERTQITGDTLRMVGRDDQVDTVFVRSNAFVAQMDSLLQRVHQIKGVHLTGLFRDDSLRTLDVGPNAEMVYYLADDEDKPDGAVKASGDTALFTFLKGKPSRVSVREGTEGTYYAEHLMPPDLNLQGYTWVPEKRPEKRDMLNHPGAVRLENVPFEPPSPAIANE